MYKHKHRAIMPSPPWITCVHLRARSARVIVEREDDQLQSYSGMYQY